MPTTIEIEKQANELASYLGEGWSPQVLSRYPGSFEARRNSIVVYPRTMKGVTTYVAVLSFPPSSAVLKSFSRINLNSIQYIQSDADARVAVTKVVALLDAYIAEIQGVREKL